MNEFHTPKVFRTPKIYHLISKIRNPEKRNLLRGYIIKTDVGPIEIDEIRRGNNLYDCELIGAILNNSDGLLGSARKKTSSDLFKLTSVSPLEFKKEIRYTIGYINSEQNDSDEVLKFMEKLLPLTTMDTDTALQILLEFSERYGASNFLSYKLAYVRSARELEPTSLELITKIEDNICHKENTGLHFSALENLSPKISLFQVAQRRGSALIEKTGRDIRKFITLSNFIPTPLNDSDIASFLLRATQSCLIDTIHSVIIILNLQNEFKLAVDIFEQHLDRNILEKIHHLINTSNKCMDTCIVTEYYKQQNEEHVDSLDIYRTSAAFIEYPRYSTYRNNMDRVIGARLLADFFENKAYKLSVPFYDKSLLLLPDNSPLKDKPINSMDVVYRTYLFLRLINDRANLLELSKDDVKFIFENTIELETLLSEEEMRAIYDTAPQETKSLVAVLALALFRKKSIDPDIDFDFRTDFIWHVNSVHNGSILDFINYLLNDSPQIASYIVSSLDEVTLEKMYTLVTNASQAAEIRCEILRAVGQKLNRIEYIIEADSITTRSKVSKLQKYFDSSRMYVDSIAMKKWLDSNPTVSTEQYRSLFPSIEARSKLGVLVLLINTQSEPLISQIAKDAFEQFCLNTEFGIQSYLGRRIRHNTLDGVTIDTVDSVLRKNEYRNIMSNIAMRRTVDAWMSSYKSIIDKLRRDHLQFKPSGSLFNSTLDLNDSTTKDNIRKLSNTLQTAGSSELLNDLIISFCWRQITPQLESAARFIKTTLLKEANASIEKYFSSDGHLEGQIKAELHEAVNEVFRKVADWFQVPQTGFISASVRDLCQIILIDLNRQNSVDFFGEAIDTKYTGISVHRLYDCLAVLLQNAHKHGEDNSRISVDISVIKIDSETILEAVSINISSTVSESMYIESKQRILNAIKSEETGVDMVTEGYSGIKKIKFITRTSEGNHTISCSGNDETRQLKLGFIMHMETATDDVHSE
ncbi:hypothetical protein MM182_03460 [Aeromonas sp. MR19]|uniref:hypothetical protein n=1 Tax=Aeromonas sp. MR19 TaxID=2923421 RepID=UPI001F4B007F|nr:hypothetical protein [Aeromonas sp. MR19]MCH7374459.1 hypothetical protein [Aeromonas sp. MR19]